jgi:hypothetical protein
MTVMLSGHNVHIRTQVYYWRACPLIGGGAPVMERMRSEIFQRALKGRRRKVEWEVIKAGRVGG